MLILGKAAGHHSWVPCVFEWYGEMYGIVTVLCR